MSRVARAAAELRLAWAAEPAELRVELESKVRESAALLAGAGRLSPRTRKAVEALAGQAIADGVIAGSWIKVRLALQAELPQWWPLLAEILPGG